MAFKSIVDYNKERYSGKFILSSDNTSVDVIFLYQSKADMLIADVHYLKSSEGSGYVHCLGTGCPVCAVKKADGTPAIRIQTKIFVPIYNIQSGEIEFWDRGQEFEHQLDSDVFDKGYSNPSEYIFRITRHGAYKSRETRYDIIPIAKNTLISYADILAKFNAKMPDYYENIVKSKTYADLTRMLQNRGADNSGINPEYVPIPRAGYQPSIPNTYVDAAAAVASMPEIPVAPVMPVASVAPEVSAMPTPPIPPLPTTEIESSDEAIFEVASEDDEVGPEPNF